MAAKIKAFPVKELAVQMSGADSTHFSIGDIPSMGVINNMERTFLVHIGWTFWEIPQNDEDIYSEAMYEGDFSRCNKVGTLTGYLILCRLMMKDGASPRDVCDEHSADLEYVVSALSDKGGPLNKASGSPEQNVLYIEKLTITPSYEGQGLESRIIRELPFLCRTLLHNEADILAFYPEPTGEEEHEELTEEDIKKEIALRSLAGERVIKKLFGNDKTIHEIFGYEESKADADVVSIADHYKFSEDEINKLMGRRHSGSAYPEALKDKVQFAFYHKLGFREAGDSRLLYVSEKEFYH